MLERARSMRPGLRQEIEETVQRLSKTLREFDPIQLLSATVMENGNFGPADWSEMTSQAHEEYVEYAQSLLLAVDQVGNEDPSKEIVDTFLADLERIFENVSAYIFTEFAEGGREEWEYELRFLLLNRFLRIRGASYELHHWDLIRWLYSPHDGWLREHIGHDVEGIIDGVRELERQIVDSLNDGLDFTFRLQQMHREFIAFVEEEERKGEKDWPEIVDSYRERPEVRSFRSDTPKSGRTSLFEVVPNEAVSEDLLSKLSARREDNRPFLELERSRGWPTNDSCIYTQPLVEEQARYYNFNHVLLFRKLDHIIESWIRADDHYYRKKFLPKRAETLETVAVDYLKACLPGSVEYRNLFYVEDYEGQLRRREIDAILTFGDVLFVVEAKSSALSHSGLRGGFNRLESDLKEIVGKASEQLATAKRYIEENPQAQFENEEGNVVLTVDGPSSRVFLVNVTLQNLGPLASRPALLRNLLPEELNLSVWSVFINDLRVISEVIESGSDLVAYLESRLLAGSHPKMMVFDELDYLMMYLHEGVDLTGMNLDAVDHLSPHGYTYELDRYYQQPEELEPPTSKPKAKRRESVTRLIRAIENYGTGFLDLAMLILKMDRPSMRQFGRGLDELVTRHRNSGRTVNFTQESSTLKRALSVVIADSWSEEALSASRLEVERQKYDRRLGRWAVIYLTPHGDGVRLSHWIDLDFPWVHDPGRDSEIEGRKTVAAAEYVRNQGEPGRNELCPCGSRRKFKKCCLPRLRSVKSGRREP